MFFNPTNPPTTVDDEALDDNAAYAYMTQLTEAAQYLLGHGWSVQQLTAMLRMSDATDVES